MAFLLFSESTKKKCDCTSEEKLFGNTHIALAPVLKEERTCNISSVFSQIGFDQLKCTVNNVCRQKYAHSLSLDKAHWLETDCMFLLPLIIDFATKASCRLSPH